MSKKTKDDINKNRFKFFQQKEGKKLKKEKNLEEMAKKMSLKLATNRQRTSIIKVRAQHNTTKARWIFIKENGSIAAQGKITKRNWNFWSVIFCQGRIFIKKDGVIFGLESRSSENLDIDSLISFIREKGKSGIKFRKNKTSAKRPRQKQVFRNDHRLPQVFY